MIWPARIWFMYELFPMTPMNGRSKRLAVWMSQPVMPNVPSPNRHKTSFAGSANFEDMANETPTPSVPSGPGSIHKPSPFGCTMPPAAVTMSPPSPMKRVFGLRNSLIS